jgi:SAM-dependent methyltransferase
LQPMAELSEGQLVHFGSRVLPTTRLSEIMLNEARLGLSRLLPVLAPLPHNGEILEVGAGHCILSAYLASNGFRVTALEPMDAEFGYFSDLQAAVLDHCRHQGFPLTLAREVGERLNMPGRFDLAFTINALEHMPDPMRTLDNMYASLKPGGVLLAHCPNYSVWFEMHLNLLLVTRSKRINEWLYKSRLDERRAIWDGLNFIRYIDLKRHIERRGWPYSFNNSALRDSIARLERDPIFAQRMPWYVRALGTLLGKSRLLDVWPRRLQSPMEVVVTKSLHVVA